MKQLLLIAMCVLLTGAAYAVSDDFESYSVGQAVADDANWYASGTVVPVATDAEALSGSQSLAINSVGNENSFVYLGDGSKYSAGSYGISFYFDPSESGQWLFLRQEAIDANENTVIAAEWRFTRRNGIMLYPTAYSDPDYWWFKEPVGISMGAWHTFQVDFDHATGLMDVFFDGAQIADDLAYPAPVAGFETYKIGMGDATTQSYYNFKGYIDDVSLVGAVPEPSLALLGLLALLKRKK